MTRHPPTPVPPDFAERLRIALEHGYAIHEPIGAGSMAVVYRATDIRHNRVVALKVLRGEIAQSIGRDRFLREIKILSGFSHPNILPLLDSGDANGFLFYVMPHVEQTLRDRLASETFLPLDEVVRFTTEIADALDFAHAAGVVHRDVKPENILIEHGHAIVADFGIAKALDEASADTATSLAIGTAAYMSPEQGDGSSHVDGRSDVYSLGCVVYEMLAGSVPFSGPTAQAIQARKTLEPFPSPRTVRSALSGSVERALKRALEVVPADRYATARDFAAALQAPDRTNSVWRAPIATLVAIAAVASIALGVNRYWGRRTAISAGPLRVAVAEFSNRTGNADLRNAGFMALDYITAGLQQLPSISVTPMTAAFEASRFSKSTAPSESSGDLAGFQRETGADVIITGAYYLTSDTLQFQARISDARTGHVLNAIGPITASLKRPETAVVELRTRAMGYFATSSDDRLAGANESKENPPTYESYKDFSDGMSAYLRSEFEVGVAKFSAAFAKDSTFAVPALFESISLFNLGRYAEADSVAHMLSRRRDRLNPYYQDWLDFRLAQLAGERPKALVAVRRLAARAPATKATFNWALEAQENGYVDEALRAIRTLPPDRGAMRGWVTYWDELGSLHHFKGDFEAELEAGRRGLAMYPDRLYAVLPIVRALAAMGRDAELDAALSTAAQMKTDPNGTSLGSLLREAAEELGAHGHVPPAKLMFARALAWQQERLRAQPSASDSVAVAGLFYASGRNADALSMLHGVPSGIAATGLRGLVDASLGHRDAARAAIEQLTAERRPYQFGASQLARARIAATLGDSVDAIDSIRDAFAAGKEYDMWIHRAPEFARLRKNPQFLALTQPRG